MYDMIWCDMYGQSMHFVTAINLYEKNKINICITEMIELGMCMFIAFDKWVLNVQNEEIEDEAADNSCEYFARHGSQGSLFFLYDYSLNGNIQL